MQAEKEKNLDNIKRSIFLSRCDRETGEIGLKNAQITGKTYNLTIQW